MMTVPGPTLTPPCFRMAMMERSRCWLVPMRPVTPFMMMPTRWVSIFAPEKNRGEPFDGLTASKLAGYAN